MDTTLSKSSVEEDQYNLKALKKRVQDWYEFFKDNIVYFNETRNFIFNRIYSQSERGSADKIGYPDLMFNVIETYLSKFIGNFSKAQPGVQVNANPDSVAPDSMLIKFLNNHLNYRLHDFHESGDGFKVMQEMLSGGFSSINIYTEYKNNYTMQQDIFIKKMWDTILTGYDPMAREVHKGDGEYCFNIVYYTEEEFKRLYEDELKKLSGKDDIGDFKINWSGEFVFGKDMRWTYKNQNIRLVGVCRIYIKKHKKFEIVEVSQVPNSVITYPNEMTRSQYNKLVKEWDEINGILPKPKVLHSRVSYREYLTCYEFTEKNIIKEYDTDLEYLPNVFFDGNSVELTQPDQSSTRVQKVRSYTHNAMGAQKAKDLTGQALVFHIENIDYTRYLMPVEGLPNDEAMLKPWVKNEITFTKFYKSQQKTQVGIEQLPPPQKLIDFPFPSEMAQLFAGWDQVIQNIMGAFDANLSQNNNELSGKAIEIAQLEANAASMPFIVNYMASLNQVAKIMLSMIPLYLVGERSLPVLSERNQKKYTKVNGKNSDVNLDYNHHDFDVVVTSGANFDLQKNQALQMLTLLSQTYPALAQIINTEGLNVVLDNVDMKGIEQLQDIVTRVIEKQQQQKMAQGMQPPPPQVQKIMSDIQESKRRMALDEAEFKHKQDMDGLEMQLRAANQHLDAVKTMQDIGVEHAKLHSQGVKDSVEMKKADLTAQGQAADIALRSAEHATKHIGEMTKLMKEINAADKKVENDEVI